jgi:hypothetical protein
MEEGEGGVVLTLIAEEEPSREGGFAYEIGEEIVGFDVGVEVVPVFEVGLEGGLGFVGDEGLARGHPVGGGVEISRELFSHWIARFQCQLDWGVCGGG